MTNRRRALAMAIAAGLPAVGLIGTASGQIQTAGDLLVNLRADHPAAGTPVWQNVGTLSPFTEVGDPEVATIDGVRYVVFGPNEAYRGPTAPADITGAGDRTIEAWVRNPTLSGEDSMVAWGHRGGPDASNLAFNFGSNASYGAVGHWGAPDMGWNGSPTANTLHHLVYTYDGVTARVYADGVEKNSRAVALNTHSLATDTINLIAQSNAAGGLEFINSDGMNIAVVRVHGGALTAGQVAANFAAGVGADVPEPATLGLASAAALILLTRRRKQSHV
jgi:Concanavalin A-like lectin/glucanases superfamily